MLRQMLLLQKQKQGRDEGRNGFQVIDCLQGACICGVIRRAPAGSLAMLCRRQWQQPLLGPMTGCYVCSRAALRSVMSSYNGCT